MKVTASRSVQYFHHHGLVGPDSRNHSHTAKVEASVDRVGYAKPIDPIALVDKLDDIIEPLYDANLHDIPGLEPQLLALAFRIREHLLSSFPDITVKMTELGLEAEVP